jgi:hypothetical protein
MADGWDVRARRVVAALSAARAQTIAYLAPRCRRVIAAARSGWAQTIAYLAPRGRRVIAAARSGWAQTIAYLAPRGRRAAATARAAGRRSRPADLRDRMSQLVKPPADADEGEYVALSELLEMDERDRQYQ